MAATHELCMMPAGAFFVLSSTLLLGVVYRLEVLMILMHPEPRVGDRLGYEPAAQSAPFAYLLSAAGAVERQRIGVRRTPLRKPCRRSSQRVGRAACAWQRCRRWSLRFGRSLPPA